MPAARAVTAILFALCLVATAFALSPDHSAMLRFTSGWSGAGCVDPSWTPVTPVCQWRGVACTADRVTGFDWESRGCSGTVNTTNLPASLQTLLLFYNQLAGTPDLTQLPSGLQVLGLASNQLAGLPNLTRLPAGLTGLFLSNNRFTGTPVLTTLPAGLQNVYLSGNQFSGTPDLTTLPSGLQTVYLFNNQLSGTPVLSSLPAGLQGLYLEGNGLCGSTLADVSCDVLSLPTTCVCASSNVTCPAC